MKKRIVQFAAVFLVAVLLLSPVSVLAVHWPAQDVVLAEETDTETPDQTADLPADDTVLRIGLAYNTKVLAGACLENSTGKGYRFGYFTDDLEFVTLGSTSETKISVVKTQNVYYVSGSYVSGTTSSIGVGCYHILLPGEYDTFSAASAAAAEVGGFPAWINGVYQVRIGAYLSSSAVNAAFEALGREDAVIVGTSKYAMQVVKTGTNKVLFQFDGGEELPLGVMPGEDSLTEAYRYTNAPDTIRAVTWFKGYRYNGAFRFERLDGGDVNVVNIVGMDDYVNCVVSREMSESWPLEALKAQACCARTYARRYINKHEKKYHFDLCYTTDCQAYLGLNTTGTKTLQAAQETSGMYIWYQDKLAETYYASCDGGATENVENVWNGSPRPYLVGVIDIYEQMVADKISGYSWTYTFTRSQIETRLRSSGRNCATLVEFYVSEFTPTGNVRAMTFKDSAGKSWTIYGNAATFLGVRSNRFTVSGGGSYYINGDAAQQEIGSCYAINGSGQSVRLDGSAMPYVITGNGVGQLVISSDQYIVSGTGNGHNIGMSQWGAYSMAKQGLTYQDIIQFYFTGVDLHR